MPGFPFLANDTPRSLQGPNRFPNAREMSCWKPGWLGDAALHRCGTGDHWPCIEGLREDPSHFYQALSSQGLIFGVLRYYRFLLATPSWPKIGDDNALSSDHICLLRVCDA